MRYIGSKSSCKDEVYEILSDYRGIQTVCDPFGGIGTISSQFKQNGHTVWTGDILRFAHYFQIARVERNGGPYFNCLQKSKFKAASDVIKYLKNPPSTEGWLVDNYSHERGFFTEYNAKKIQGCWDTIRNWDNQGLLTRLDKAVLIASLIDSMDKVANTAGTYYAYLKEWYRKAENDFEFQMISNTPGPNDCRAYLKDARNLVNQRHFDLVYLDPPHSDRQYSRYYHLPETIAKGKEVNIKGKSGVPVQSDNLSPFSKSSKVVSAFETLLSKACCDILAVHYSDGGLVAPEELKCLLQSHGTVDHYEIKTTGYTAGKSSRTTTHQLYVVT